MGYHRGRYLLVFTVIAAFLLIGSAKAYATAPGQPIGGGSKLSASLATSVPPLNTCTSLVAGGFTCDVGEPSGIINLPATVGSGYVIICDPIPAQCTGPSNWSDLLVFCTSAGSTCNTVTLYSSNGAESGTTFCDEFTHNCVSQSAVGSAPKAYENADGEAMYGTPDVYFVISPETVTGAPQFPGSSAGFVLLFALLVPALLVLKKRVPAVADSGL